MNNQFPQVDDMFSREDEEKDLHTIEVFNASYVILPGVFSPKIRNNSLWYAKRIPKLLSGKSFLEIGAGTGILAIEVAKLGYSVVATDIDSQAIKNIKLNSEGQGIMIDVREGNLFDPIKEGEKFDTIFWNHPWIYSEEKVDKRHRVSFDYKYKDIKRFIEEAKFHLEDNGQILLGTGSLARLEVIVDWAKKEGYEIKIECKEVQPLSVGGESKAELLIYSLVRQRS